MTIFVAVYIVVVAVNAVVVSTVVVPVTVAVVAVNAVVGPTVVVTVTVVVVAVVPRKLLLKLIYSCGCNNSCCLSSCCHCYW